MSRYEQGDVVAVPLRDAGYACGVIARVGARGVILGYFFARRHDTPAVPRALSAALEPRAADYVTLRGDLGLMKGTWTVIGRHPEWHREERAMPAFCRREAIRGRCFKVQYPDDDPSALPTEAEISPEECAELPEDGLAGAEFVEIRLTRLAAARSES